MHNRNRRDREDNELERNGWERERTTIPFLLTQILWCNFPRIQRWIHFPLPDLFTHINIALYVYALTYSGLNLAILRRNYQAFYKINWKHCGWNLFRCRLLATIWNNMGLMKEYLSFYNRVKPNSIVIKNILTNFITSYGVKSILLAYKEDQEDLTLWEIITEIFEEKRKEQIQTIDEEMKNLRSNCDAENYLFRIAKCCKMCQCPFETFKISD